MNKNLKYILQTLSVIALVIAGLWVRKSLPSAKSILPSKSDTTITIIQYIDSSTHTVNQISEIKYRAKSVARPVNIDTQAVIRQYFTKRITQNSYRDSNLSLTVFDTLYQNAISGRSFSYKILKPNTQITKTVACRDKGLYIGASYFPSSGVYPNVSYAYKNWQVGAGIVNINKQALPFFNLQYKIR